MEISNEAQKGVVSRKEERAKLFYGFLKNYNSLNTQEAYKRDLKEFLVFLVDTFKINEFSMDHAHAVAYKDSLIAKGLSHSSINRKLACASAYVEHLIHEGFKQSNPFYRVKRFRGSRIGLTPGIDIEVLKDCISRIDRSTETGLLRFAIVRVFIDTGIRVEALCRLRLKSLAKDSDGVYLQYIDKGDKHNKAHLTAESVEAINEYLLARSQYENLRMDCYLFKSFSSNAKERLNRKSINFMFDEIFSEFSYLGISPHSARTFFITEIIKREGLSKAQARANHSEISSTIKYDRSIYKLDAINLLES